MIFDPELDLTPAHFGKKWNIATSDVDEPEIDYDDDCHDGWEELSLHGDKS